MTDMEKYFYKWIAAQTVANEFFQYIKDDLAQALYRMQAEQLRKNTAKYSVKEKALREKLYQLKSAIERDFSNYNMKTTDLIKQFDDHPSMPDLVQAIHDVLDSVNFIESRG